MFIDYMAKKHGYKKNDLRNLFKNIKEEKKLKKFFKKAPERRLTWNGCEQNEKQCINYKSLFVTDHNIKNGILFIDENYNNLKNRLSLYLSLLQLAYMLPNQIHHHHNQIFLLQCLKIFS